MDIFNTGMAFTFDKNFSNSQPLRRYLVAIIPEFFGEIVKLTPANSGWAFAL
jgi:hypothetical protein